MSKPQLEGQALYTQCKHDSFWEGSRAISLGQKLVFVQAVKQFQCEAKSYSKLAVANLHEQKHEKKHNGIPLREARLNFSDSISSRDVTE